ncbi:hypothetical protein GCM10011578_091390 [Streptomyces fuscichromogenes]|uniref:Uncharacterized protein n=1 Tax=Streptomyces fuscichromogenes TaxID=1324013 RepID=A0A917XNT8_9ACTN|nr:hypothetical protein GCM10011578_091390 [Streptomyces fuscichromogenes]
MTGTVLAVIAQGAKRLALGDRAYEYGAGQYLPRFRERGSGVIVNATSSVVLGHLPLSAGHKASKTAVEGFTASLALEFAPFGVSAKTVEPGACLTTNFAARATNGTPLDELVPAPYAPWAKQAMAEFTGQDLFTQEGDVAETVRLAQAKGRRRGT